MHTTLRVGLVADSHYDETSRFEECVRLHDWIAFDGADRHVDLWLHAGDVYERRSTPRERAAVAAWVQRLARWAPVVIVRGNHDQLGDLPLLEKLSTTHPVRVVESAAVVVVESAAVVHISPNTLENGVYPWSVRVACLAWPRKGELLAATGAVGEAAQQDGQQALRAVLGELGAQMHGDEAAGLAWPRILLAHAMVRGSVTSTGQPLVGCDHDLGLEDLALADAHVVALGHIHKGQSWEHGGVPILYPGSPRRTAFGELEAKGYVVITFERGNADWRLAGWEFIEAPATPMVLITAEVLPGGILQFGPELDRLGDRWESFPPSAEVRLRYTVDADLREAGRARAEEWAELCRECGKASVVKVEEVVRPHATARAPEIGAAEGLPAQLDAYWKAARVDLTEERRDRVLGLAADLEGSAVQ